MQHKVFYLLHRFHLATFLRKAQPAQARVPTGGEVLTKLNVMVNGNFLLVSGAFVATILMLGALHARRLKDDKMIEEARKRGVELEFHPDAKLFIEPRLRMNHPHKKLLYSEPPDEPVYEPEGMGVTLKKGDELAAFNMGSTVVLVFQAPNSQYSADRLLIRFQVLHQEGRMGEALGRWHDEKNNREIKLVWSSGSKEVEARKL